MKPVSLLFLVTYLAGCSHQSVNQATQQERLGFVLSNPVSYYGVNNALIYGLDFPVVAMAGKIVSPVPTVVVASRMAQLETTSPWSWQVDSVPTGTLVPFCIAWGSDTLNGLLPIPKAIDSAYCNGVNLSESSVVPLSIDSTYVFTWHSAGDHATYLIYAEVSEVIQGQTTSYQDRVSDTFYKIGTKSYPPWTVGATITLSVAASFLPMVPDTMQPSFDNGTIFVYNQIQGPVHTVTIQLGRSGFAKLSSGYPNPVTVPAVKP